MDTWILFATGVAFVVVWAALLHEERQDPDFHYSATYIEHDDE
jgi:hypothetical protein